MARIEMNTNSLQKKFSDIYKDFFARNNLVLSGCFNFPWCPSGVGKRSSYISIKSKIPLKCYVGFKLKKQSGVILRNVDFYNITLDSFESVEYSKINKESSKISEFIGKFLVQNNIHSGVEIEFLSETSRGHSFGFTGTSSAIMAVGLFQLSGKLDMNSFQNYNHFTQSPNFQLIENLSTQLSLITKIGNSAGQNTKHTLHNNSDPSFLVAQKFEKLTLENIETIQTKFVKIGENCKQNLISIDIPFDYYMVFSGISTDSNQVANYIKGNEKRYNDYNVFVKDFILGDDFDGVETNLSKYISDEKFVYHSLTENLNILGIKTVELFKNIFENGYDNNLVEDFIDNINNYNNVVSLIEKQSGFQEYFLDIFKKNQYNNDEKVGILPAYSGKIGGGYVVVTKQGISRKTVENTLSELKNIYPNVAVEYCSFEDGTSSDGIILEQFISEGIYSKYLDKNKVLYTDNKGNSFLGDYGELMDSQKDGLLFDMINNKIYLNGEKLTSKDIPSQNTTIEVITKLLENIGEEISNKELPVSSYTSNKNEMLGKIILPLLKFIEEKTSEKLSLVCKGGITDFYIKMGEIHLRIGIIKKI